MLNQSGVTTVTATTPNSILADPKTLFSLPCIVANTGVVADSDGKKILKAGTPISGDATNRATAFVRETTAPTAVLLHDVDVTAGNANATALLFGFVDLALLDTTTAALITSGVKTALAGKVMFVK